MGQDEASRARAATIADYWRGRYDALGVSPMVTEHDQDPQIMLARANAAYRAAMASRQVRPAQVQALDSVLQAYAAVLKAGDFLPDASFNYEFVARQRETLARGRAPAGAAAPADAATPVVSADLPNGATIHGRPGGPPPRAKGEEFEIIAPMEFGDRETQPEPNAGGKPLRRG
jgi:hypothetical protein